MNTIKTKQQKFNRDLTVGQIEEDKVLSFIRKKYPDAHRKEGEFKYYDIIIPSTGITFEVKKDQYAPHNGYIAVEISYKDKQSGIMESTADWWVYVVDNTAYFVKRNELLLNLNHKKILNAGDDAQIVRFYLHSVPWELITNI